MISSPSLRRVVESDAPTMTRTEVAELFRVDARTISKAIAEGTLPSIKLGRRVVIPRVRLLSMLTGDAASDISLLHAPNTLLHNDGDENAI